MPVQLVGRVDFAFRAHEWDGEWIPSTGRSGQMVAVDLDDGLHIRTGSTGYMMGVLVNGDPQGLRLGC